jgi:hypothetical protein
MVANSKYTKKKRKNKNKNKKKNKKQTGGMSSSETENMKRTELAKSLYGTPKTVREITDDYLKEHMDSYGTPFQGIGELYKYRLERKLEEGQKERRKFDTMIDTMKKRDESLKNMESVGLLDLPHQIEEFQEQSCQQIGRLCQTNKQYRDYCADAKINYKYIVPCKIEYDIKQLFKRIIKPQVSSMSQGYDPYDPFKIDLPNIAELDIFTYLKAYLSWSIFKVTDYQIVVKLNTQERIWGTNLPEPAGDANVWSDLLTEEKFMDYVSAMDPETALATIQRYRARQSTLGDPTGEMEILNGVVDTLSMYETGSLSWWTTALMCEIYARPVLDIKEGPPRMTRQRRIGFERFNSTKNRLLNMLFSLEKRGFDAFNGISNRDRRGSMSSVKDVWETFTDLSIPGIDENEIYAMNSTHKELFLKDGLKLFESIGFNKTILLEYFHEYLYLFNFLPSEGIYETNYEYLPHMKKFKRPLQIENELKQVVERRYDQDLV